MASSAAAGACALRQQRPDSYERRVLELRGMLAASGRAPYPAAAQSVSAPRSTAPQPPPAGGAAEEVLKEDAARLRSLSTASQDCDAAEEGETAEAVGASTEVDRIARARARNREHARNTRARKKARIADMQRRVDALNDEASRLRLQLEVRAAAPSSSHRPRARVLTRNLRVT